MSDFLFSKALKAHAAAKQDHREIRRRPNFVEDESCFVGKEALESAEVQEEEEVEQVERLCGFNTVKQGGWINLHQVASISFGSVSLIIESGGYLDFG